MLPTELTIAGILGGAPAVVTAFGTLLLLVVTLGFGIWVVKRIPGMVKRARR